MPLEREPLMVRIDPDGWLLKTLKFERSTRMLSYQLAHDADVLGRIEAAEALGEKNDEESFNALVTALNNDAFWGVRVTVASALSKLRSAKAQEALIAALQTLDATTYSRVRAALASALGAFSAPQQAELAQRSAQVLHDRLEQGDVSYRVESAAASALGRTRTGNIEFLTGLLTRPSWMSIVQRGIFAGLAATEDESVVDIMAQYMNNPANYPTLRHAAAAGLFILAQKRSLYSDAARQRAVTALCHALEHDIWPPVRAMAALALLELGERRAIATLENAASRELESSVQRRMRVAAHYLATGGKDDEQFKNLRKDLDEVREENRQLKEQLGSLEARMR